MPWTLRIDRDMGLVHTVHTGDVTLREALEVVDTLRNHPDFEPSMMWFNDQSEATMKFRPIEIRSMARMIPFKEGSRVAFVVQGAVDFGQVRMGASVTEDAEVRAFQDRSEALAWLGLADDALPLP